MKVRDDSATYCVQLLCLFCCDLIYSLAAIKTATFRKLVLLLSSGNVEQMLCLLGLFFDPDNATLKYTRCFRPTIPEVKQISFYPFHLKKEIEIASETLYI